MSVAVEPDTPENRSRIFREMEDLRNLRFSIYGKQLEAEQSIKLFPQILSYGGQMVS